MKLNRVLYCVLAFILLVVSCNNDHINESKEDKGDYVRLNLTSGCGYSAATDDSEITRAGILDDKKGEGDLALQWESVGINSTGTGKIAFFISDSQNPIYGRASLQGGSSNNGAAYSGLAVIPHKDDAHHADFQTVNYYLQDDLYKARYCYAVSGNAEISEDATNKVHLCHLQMPGTFVQASNQDPAFLRDYMFMYASTGYKLENTVLEFKHIPAVFRFIVSNSKREEILLQEASIALSDASGSEEAFVASTYADLAFNWADGDAGVTFSNNGYSRISVNAANGTFLKSGEKYTAYLAALPLPDNSAFKGKCLNFNIKFNDNEVLAFQLEGEELSGINGSGIYNWKGGKSYTIRVNVEDDDQVTGEIVAGNCIEVTAKSPGTYTLVYEKADGQILVNYAAICSIPVDSIARYEEFIDVNTAPDEAAAIGIYNSAGERMGSIELAGIVQGIAEKPLYTYGLLSDVHIGRSGINAEEDFRIAIEFFNAHGVDFTCICGDITNNGKESEFKIYQEIAATAKNPVYTTTGNHDCVNGGTNNINEDCWTKYTGHPLFFEKTVEIDGGAKDHFLFFGMKRYNYGAAYNDTSIAWLKGKLKEYKDERCFIVTHMFFPERAGNMNNVYPSGNWLRGEQLTLLENLCDSYPNTVWFSGHSHWEWELQKYQDRANIYRAYNDGKAASGWCVHVSSCGVPISSNGTSRVDDMLGSEGAIVKVYKDYIDIAGVDFTIGKFLPIATYRLGTN